MPAGLARPPLGSKSLAGHSNQRFRRSYSSLRPNLTLTAASAAAELSVSLKYLSTSLQPSSVPLSIGHHSPSPPSAVVTTTIGGPQASVHFGASAAALAFASDPTLTSYPTPTISLTLIIASAESTPAPSFAANTGSNDVSVNASVASSALSARALSNTTSAGNAEFERCCGGTSGSRVRQPPPNVK